MGYGKCTFGNRRDIILNLLSKNLDIDIYGTEYTKITFPDNYKG